MEKIENTNLNKNIEGGNEDSFEQKVEKEIFPILKILKPNDVDFESYKDEMLASLFQDIEKIEKSEGKLVQNLDDTIKKVKEVIINRLKIALENKTKEKYNSKEKIDSDFIKKARIVLLSEGDLSDWKKSRGRDTEEIKDKDASSLLRFYLNLSDHSEYKKENALNAEEVRGLLRGGLGKVLINRIADYEYLEYIKETPDELLQLIIKEKPYNLPIYRVLEASADPNGYSSETLKLLIKNGESYSVFKNLHLFEKIASLENMKSLIISYSPQYPYNIDDIIKYLEYNKSFKTEEKKELIDFALKHQKISDKNRDLESISDDDQRKKYKNIIDDISKNFREDYGTPESLSDEKLNKLKKYIEDGHITFFHANWSFVIYLIEHHYDWLMEQVFKNDQENLLFSGPGSHNLMKLEDQEKYAKKLINQDQAYILKSIVEKGSFSKNALSQEVYEKLLEIGYTPSITSFHDLDKNIFKKNIKEESGELKKFNLFYNINKFNFKDNTELKDYKKYQDFVFFVKNLFKLSGYEILYNSLDLEFSEVMNKNLDEYKLELKRKLDILKEKLPALYSEPEEGYRLELFQKEFDFYILRAEEESLRAILDSVRYLPLKIRRSDAKELSLDFLKIIKDFDDEKKEESQRKLQDMLDVFDLKGNTEFFDRYISFLKNEDLSDISIPADFDNSTIISKYSLFYKNLDVEKKKFFQLIFPWSESLLKIENIQKRVKNPAYDPWKNSFERLIESGGKNNIIELSNAMDGELTAEFVDKFGMKNIPELFKLFIEIKKSKSIDDIDLQTKELLLNDFGIDVEKLLKKDKTNMNLIINKIEKFQLDLFNKFVSENDEIVEKALNSKYILEMIEIMKGNSGFSHSGTTGEVIKKYLEESQKNPGKFKLLSEYKEVKIEIPEIVYNPDEINDLVELEKKKVLDNTELNNSLSLYKNIIKDIITGPGLDQYFEETREKVGLYFDNIRGEISTKISEEEKKDNQNEKMLIGLRLRLEKNNKQFSKFRSEFIGMEEKTISQILEIIQEVVPDDLENKKDILLNMSLRDIYNKMPDGFGELSSDFENLDKKTLISRITNFIGNHVREHYLNKKHGEEDALNSGDKNLIKSLKKFWGTNGFEKGIFFVMNNKLNDLEKGQLSDKKRSISLIPSKGLMRIFSGDLGGACTSKQNMELAKGNFEDTISYSLVIDKGDPKNERFVGSFLIIESQIENGENALVLRANNPAENIFNMVDGEFLINEIMKEVKNVAERRGIKNVLMPLASGVISNRSQVSGYCNKIFNVSEKVGLKKTPDTEFNGYTIWNKESSSYVVRI